VIERLRKLGPGWRRLLLLLLVAPALWLWSSGHVPRTRTLVWQPEGDFARIRRVDLQVWEDGALLKREQISFPNGVSGPIEQKVMLGAGTYEAVFSIDRDAGESAHGKRAFEVGREDTYVLSLER
jgi:hypothetical protein